MNRDLKKGGEALSLLGVSWETGFEFSNRQREICFNIKPFKQETLQTVSFHFFSSRPIYVRCLFHFYISWPSSLCPILSSNVTLCSPTSCWVQQFGVNFAFNIPAIVMAPRPLHVNKKAMWYVRLSAFWGFHVVSGAGEWSVLYESWIREIVLEQRQHFLSVWIGSSPHRSFGFFPSLYVRLIVGWDRNLSLFVAKLKKLGFCCLKFTVLPTIGNFFFFFDWTP